jgi:hypothetical protein
MKENWKSAIIFYEDGYNRKELRAVNEDCLRYILAHDDMGDRNWLIEASKTYVKVDNIDVVKDYLDTWEPIYWYSGERVIMVAPMLEDSNVRLIESVKEVDEKSYQMILFYTAKAKEVSMVGYDSAVEIESKLEEIDVLETLGITWYLTEKDCIAAMVYGNIENFWKRREEIKREWAKWNKRTENAIKAYNEKSSQWKQLADNYYRFLE